MMETDKFILCGGEDLCRTYEGGGISQRGRALFDKLAIESLADPCLHGRETFLDMPVSADRRLFIRAVCERNKGSRALTWYVGVEVGKEEIFEASCYANFIRGMLALSLQELKNLRSSTSLSILFQYPSGLPQVQTPFAEMMGQNLYGAYPQNLWAFCQKISLNDMDAWFERLFLAVNVEVERPEYTNIVCEVRPHLIATPSSSNQCERQEMSRPSGSSDPFKEVQNRMRKLLLPLCCIAMVGALYWGFVQTKRLAECRIMLMKKDRIHQEEISRLECRYEMELIKKESLIKDLNEKTATLSAPADLKKGYAGIKVWICELERDVSAKLKESTQLKEWIQRLKEVLVSYPGTECVLPKEPAEASTQTPEVQTETNDYVGPSGGGVEGPARGDEK